MPKYTIESTYRLPIFRQRTYAAPTVEDACRLALDDNDWNDEKQDYETAGQTYITGAWSCENAAYKGDAIPVPSNFDEAIRRKADHFEALVAVLAQAAQPMGVPRVDIALWLSRAQAILAKAEAIRAGLPDPETPSA